MFPSAVPYIPWAFKQVFSNDIVHTGSKQNHGTTLANMSHYNVTLEDLP